MPSPLYITNAHLYIVSLMSKLKTRVINSKIILCSQCTYTIEKVLENILINKTMRLWCAIIYCACYSHNRKGPLLSSFWRARKIDNSCQWDKLLICFREQTAGKNWMFKDISRDRTVSIFLKVKKLFCF